MRLFAGALGGVVALTLVNVGGGCANGRFPAGFDSDDGGATLDFGEAGLPNCVRCSADLHQVLDCQGHVVQTCAPDRGCGADGACVEPCEAAKANGSTVGCDFYAATTAPMNETRGSCYAVLIANTWAEPIHIYAEYGGAPLKVEEFARIPKGSGNLTYVSLPAIFDPVPEGRLDPGQVAILFLSSLDSGDMFYVGCPPSVAPAVFSHYSAVAGTGMGHAFHITTDRPIVAYDIYPYGGAWSFVTSASLLVPTPAWGKNYVGIGAYAPDPELAEAHGYPYLQILGAEDDTTVTLNPTATITGSPLIPGTEKGHPVSYKVNKGQFIQIMQEGELTGSPITSDKPVSVFGGSSCMHIPLGVAACDSGHQQLLPVSTLGSEYVAVRYANRVLGQEEQTPWRFVGAVDGTKLTFEPASVAAPRTLATSEVFELTTATPFVVHSQDSDHPFYVSGHMTGAALVDGLLGDPDFVNVVPPLQYLSSYLFLTDPTYSTTNLVFTRGKASDGTYHDVTLDCLGTLGGWQAIGASGFEFTRVDLIRDSKPNGKCNNGVHAATSDAPFGLTVWGWDVTASYAYPAGMNVQPINSVVVPTLVK